MGFTLVVALLSVVPRAFAWDIGKSSNGLVINRTAEDTNTVNTVTVVRYYGYKGGESYWSGSYAPMNVASWNYNDSVYFAGASSSAGMEIPLKEGYRLQMVLLTQTATADQKFAVVNEAVRVETSGTVPVSVAETLPVSLATSASIAGTLPVEVGGVPDWAEAFAALLAFSLGLVTVGGVVRWTH